MEDYDESDDNHDRRTESRLEKRRNNEVVDSYDYYGNQNDVDSEDEEEHYV